MSIQFQEATGERKIFEDPSHADKISEMFHQLYQEQKFLDVVLVSAIDNVKVKAHRIVISAASDYFMGLLSSPLKEADVGEIQLQNIDGNILLAIIEFIYSGNISLQNETVQNILIAADFLQMNNLVANCWQYISKNLDDDNCLGIALFADQLNNCELSKRAHSMAFHHLDELMNENEFSNMSKEQLTNLISFRSQASCSKDEETIFLCIGKWANYDRAQRINFVYDLLTLVNYQKLTPGFIIKNRRSVCWLVECYELLLCWIEWHLLPESRQLLQCQLTRKEKNIVLIIPGYKSTDDLRAQKFMAQVNKWLKYKLPNLPTLKKSFGVAVIDEALYIVGGKTFNDRKFVSSRTVEYLENNEWKEFPPMQEPRHNCVVAELNKKMYAIGGYSGSCLLCGVEMYDFMTGKWCFVAPLIFCVKIPQPVVLNGMIYIIDVIKGTLQCYNPSTNEWSLKSSKQGNSTYFGTAAGCGYLYAAGGYIGGKSVNTVERYNPNDDTWAFVAPMQIPRGNLKCVFLNDRMFACGGRNIVLTDEVEEYNPETNKWKSLAPLEYPLDRNSKIFSL